MIPLTLSANKLYLPRKFMTLMLMYFIQSNCGTKRENLDVVLDKCFSWRIYLLRRKLTHTETANNLRKYEYIN